MHTPRSRWILRWDLGTWLRWSGLHGCWFYLLSFTSNPSTCFLETGSLTGAHQFCQVGWPVGSRKPPCPPPQSCEYRHSQLHLALCMDAGDLNSGPSDCRESILLSNPSPYSSQTILILCDELLLLRLMPYLKKKSWLFFSFFLSFFLAVGWSPGHL